MKNKLTLLLLLALTGISGCIKIEKETINCPGKPVTPQAVSSIYNKNIGDTVIVELVNREAGFTYSVNTPDGYTLSSINAYPFQIPLNSLGKSGQYSITSFKSGLFCQSDSGFFTVNAGVDWPSGCAIAENTFKFNTSGAFATTTAYGYDYGDYFTSNWSTGSKTIRIDFNKAPSKTHIEVYTLTTSSYPENLDDYQCQMTYDSGNNYYNGYNGIVFTRFINNQYQYVFCNVDLSYYGTYYPASGNLTSLD